jgi:hypothetical protein
MFLKIASNWQKCGINFDFENKNMSINVAEYPLKKSRKTVL